MKKTKLTRSLLAACSIVALSAVMYGCSSGPSQDELDAANAATDAAEAKAEVDAAAAATAAEEAAAASATAAEEAAAASATAAEEAAAASATAAEEAAAASATAAEEAAAAAATAAEEAAAAAATAAEEAAAAAATAAEEAEAARQAAQDEADRLQDDLDDKAAAKASDDAKELLNKALVDPGDPGNLMATTEVPEELAERAILERMPSPTVSVSKDGMLTASASGYTMAEADTIEGWRGATLTANDMGGDTAVVYSDIGGDGTESLLDRYVSNLPTTDSPRTWDIDNDDDLETATDDATDNADNDISWSDVKRPDDDTSFDGPDGSVMLTFMGSVHGIDGMFSCAIDTTIAECRAPARYTGGSVETDTDVNNGASGAWTFAPDEGADIDTDDTDYLIFGWWLDKGPDGKPDWVRLIARAEGLDMRANANTEGSVIRGKATYEGAAAGKYAMASTAGDIYEGGHFTAIATLTADFDVDLVADVTNQPSTVGNDRAGIALSGTIDNFMTGDTPSDWTVMLKAGDGTDLVDDPAPNTDGRTMTTEWSTGAAQNGVGTWTADWYGGDPDEHPTAVTGTFNAHIRTEDADPGAVGRLQGAFGANLKADE